MLLLKYNCPVSIACMYLIIRYITYLEHRNISGRYKNLILSEIKSLDIFYTLPCLLIYIRKRLNNLSKI